MTDNHQPPMEERDDIARLLRLAGKRGAVPQDRAERVREAARAQWRMEVRRRSRSRYRWIGAGLAAAAAVVLGVTLLFLPVTSSPGDLTAGALVEMRVGGAWMDSSREALVAGDQIPPDAPVETSRQGRIAIRLASGHSVRLDTDTAVRLQGDGRLSIERGAVYIDSGPGAAASPLEVQTPLGTIRETGTQYEVRLEGEAVTLRLREGSAAIHHHSQTHEVRAGNEIEVAPDGSVRWKPIQRHGPEWDWILGITPMPDLEGKTVREFLDWAARERGRRIVFADQAVARTAGETTLTGTLEGQTLEEALESVLLASRMTSRVEGPSLVVEAVP